MNRKIHEEAYKSADKIKYPTYREFAYSLKAQYAKQVRTYKKNLVYSHYGRICNCCGETEEKFLSIDHVNDDGNIDRRQHGGGKSNNIILKIIARGFPNTYQILCMNCNTGKSRNNGTCPHKEKN